MKFTTLSLAACITLVSSMAIDVNKRASALEVTLEVVGNSKVKASVTNTASRPYNLFYKASFLDNQAPVDKFVVSSSSARVAFSGVRLRMSTANEVLTAENFKSIGAGETLTTEVDIASLYSVETSDSYTVQATDSTNLTGSSLAFTSNMLAMDIDGAEASTVAKAFQAPTDLQKRTRVASFSYSSRLSTLRTALSKCASLATTAATAASSGSSSKFQEYFKTTSTTGTTTTYCSDVYGYCTSGVLAYTIPGTNEMAYCNLFYTAIPALTSTYHDQDQTTTVLHEETHAPAVYSPGTEDYAYGYSAAQQLDSSQAVLNADTDAQYANALYAGC